MNREIAEIVNTYMIQLYDCANMIRFYHHVECFNVLRLMLFRYAQLDSLSSFRFSILGPVACEK